MEYVCQDCGGVFDRQWSDAEAIAEARHNFGVADPVAAGYVIVCDDCYRAIMRPRTMPEPETQIDLRCPECGHVWNVAAVLTGVWWSRAVTPAAIAALCWCPNCRSAPPMEPAPPPPLFREAR